jgi:predicted histidine transporter YuiF (NhaC family)
MMAQMGVLEWAPVVSLAPEVMEVVVEMGAVMAVAAGWVTVVSQAPEVMAVVAAVVGLVAV